MNRRGFLGLLLGLLVTPIVRAARPVPARTSGFTFNWQSTPPWTDDPRYAGNLSRGPHNRTLLNGEPVGATLGCRTGPDGWVHVFNWASHQRDTLHGHVTYHDLREKE